MQKATRKPSLALKGGAFERRCAVDLSRWITAGEQKDCFWRSAMSGGRATVAAKRGTNLARQAGDLTATAPEGHVLTDRLFFELKHYKDLRIDSFMLGQGPLATFWKKARIQAARHQREPVMIIRTFHFSPMIITLQDGAFRDYHPATVITIDGMLPCRIMLLPELLALPFIGLAA